MKTRHSIKSNLSASEMRYAVLEGRKHLVVPVVMARVGVVMNGALTVSEELLAEGWNGRPVTVGHPEQEGEFHTANAPHIAPEWCVGQLFNAVVADDALRAEAWIDIAKAKKVAPGLLARLKSGERIDVSTGFFAQDEEASGVSKGKEYSVISRQWVPDHLALLPDEEGACNWEDGCGVRFNTSRGSLMKIKQKVNSAVGGILAALGFDSADEAKKKLVANELQKLVGNERGADDDARQIVADLISNEDSPFVPDDEDSLRMMSPETLKKMRAKFLAAEGEEEPDGDEAPAANEGEEEEESVVNEEGDEEEPSANADDEEEQKVAKAKKNCGCLPKSRKELDALIANAVTTAVGKAISKRDRLAINTAAKIAADQRSKLVAHVVANSAMKKADAEKLDLPTLELFANSVAPKADYSGRATIHANLEDDDDAVKAMMPVTTASIIKNRRKDAH